MTDRLELAIRERLRAEAACAPTPADLATGAIALAHRRRRRTAWRAGAALAVALTLGGTALAVALPREQQTVPVAPHPSPSGTITLDGALTDRGASVSVPTAWLDPANAPCGVAIRDAAYVLPAEPGPCQAAPVHPERITEVVFMPWKEQPLPYPDTLPDGRTQLTTRVPVTDSRLLVRSPDPALAHRIFDSLTVESDTCYGSYWLEASNGRAAAVVDWESTLQVAVDDTITVHAAAGCALPKLSSGDYDVLTLPDETVATTLLATAPGTVDVSVGAPMCQPADGPACAGGYAAYGTVRVTVVDPASPSR